MKIKRIIAAMLAAWSLLLPAQAAEQASYQAPTAGPMNMATFVGTHLNPALRALATCNWGPTAPANGPSSAVAELQCWWDTSGAPYVLKWYVGAQWVAVANINASTHAFTLPGHIIGTDVQAFDADLAAIAGLTSANNKCFYFTGSGTAATYDCSSFGRSVANAADAAALRTLAGSVIGTDVQAFDADLAAIAGLTSANNKCFYFTGSGTAATYDCSSFGRSVANVADAAALRTLGGLVIGTNVQAFDADLSALAGNSTDGLWAHTGAGTGAARTLTAPAAGLTITNPAGIAGNPTFALANDLAALEGLASTGIARRTGSDAWSVGTAVANSELATMAAYSFKMNATGSAAAPTDVEISTLTTKASPAAGDYVLVSDQAAGGQVKKTTVSALSSAGSVASLNSLTGALNLSVTKQTFAASGTYTPTSGMLYAQIECYGGGGSGGSVPATTGRSDIAGGGGAGSKSIVLVTAAQVGASQTVTIGAGGTAPSAGANNGNAGGDSSVGTLCVGKGGSGGNQSGSGQTPTGGLGGVAGTGDTTGTGQAGFSGRAGTDVSNVNTGGAGGSTDIGGGGRAVYSTTVSNGSAGTGYGSGGSGAAGFNNAGTGAGGAGAPGYIRITEYNLQ
jgi:hypothetical protein